MEGNEESLREKLEAEIRAELEKEFKSEGKTKSSEKSESKAKSKPKAQSKPKSKPKSGGMFGAKLPKKTYEGEPGGKADWFLEEALDTVYIRTEQVRQSKVQQFSHVLLMVTSVFVMLSERMRCKVEMVLANSLGPVRSQNI